MARPSQHEGWDLPEVVRHDESAPTTAVGEGFESIHASDEALKKSVFSGPEVATDADKRIPGGKEVYTPQPPSDDRYDGEAPEVVPTRKRFWTRKKIWIAVGVAVVAIIAIVVGAVVGTLVGGSDDSGDESSPTSSGSENEDNTTTASSRSTPTSTTAAPFGTPTSFSDSLQGSDSACSGDICRSVLASAATSSSDDDDDSSFLLVALGNDGEYWYRQAGEDGWDGDWESLGGNFYSQPAVAASSDGRIDVFGVLDGSLKMVYKTSRSGTWESEWSDLSGQCYSPPSVCGFSDGSIAVFTSSSDHRLAAKSYRNGKWDPDMEASWQRHLTGYLGSAPVVACNYEDVDFNVIGFGGDDSDDPREAMIKWGTDFYLSYWRTSGGDFHGDPVAFLESKDSVHVFGFAADDDALYHAVWTSVNATKTDDEPKRVSGGGDLISVPTVFRNHHDQIDVLAVGKDGKLKRNTLVNATMDKEGWEDLGGFFSSAPMVRLTANSTVSVFGIGPEGSMIHGKWTVDEDHSWSDGEWYDDGGDFSTVWYSTES